MAAAALDTGPAPAAPSGDWGLAPPLAEAVRRLPSLPVPKVSRPVAWGVIVADAVRLACGGWAATALALGWEEHDLFGIGLRSSDEFEGLAVWLAGRDLRALTEWKARTDCGAVFYREAFGRPNSPRLPSVYLWQFGRA